MKKVHWLFHGVEDSWIPCHAPRAVVEVTDKKDEVTCKACLKAVTKYPGVEKQEEKHDSKLPDWCPGCCKH